MGVDCEHFVHPERISKELMCCICTQVLENPVQTPSEHLFCEDELLEWLSRSTLCPATNEPLDPSTIRRPSRIILNMLAELQRFCPNRAEGCPWVGENGHCATHTQTCAFRPRAQLLEELRRAEDKIARLKDKLLKAEKRVELLSATNAELVSANDINERKLRVYSAFLDVDGEYHTTTASQAQPQPQPQPQPQAQPQTQQPQAQAKAQPRDREMSSLERAARELTVMEKLGRLQKLHGSLAEISLDAKSADAK